MYEGLPNIPTCLSYTPGLTSDDPSVLFIGDDHGSIITLKFQQAEYCLFQRNNSDKADTYFWKVSYICKIFILFMLCIITQKRYLKI